MDGCRSIVGLMGSLLGPDSYYLYADRARQRNAAYWRNGNQDSDGTELVEEKGFRHNLLRILPLDNPV